MQSELGEFYALLSELEQRIGGRRRLGDCHGRMSWPQRGVYFFFEPGEYRASSSTQRVVRVGTHALTAGSRATLWNRLSQHRGTNSKGGNHRGSIFRLLIGEAMLSADGSEELESWGRGSSASRELRELERTQEKLVSEYLGGMSLLFLEVPDGPGPDSARGIIERSSIALLSHYVTPTADVPSAHWLGLHSGRDRVRRSGLWNNNHVDERYDPSFLKILGSCIRQLPSS